MAETIIPEGRGRAEAMRTFLATGGERVSRGGSRYPGYRYTQGALKGMTQEQAESEFENRWSGASGDIKDKYARMASPEGVLSPSEMKRYQGPKPSLPKPPAAPAAPRPAPKPADISNEPGVSGMVQGPPTPAVSAEIAKRSSVVGPPAPTGYAGPAAPRINRLTGLPFGYKTGDKLPTGASPAMQAAAAGSARNMEAADQAPRATDAQAAAATQMMERDGAIPTKPVASYAGPRPATPGGPARSDGYRPTSQEQDWRRDERNVATVAAGKMTNEEAGFVTPDSASPTPTPSRTGFALARRR